MFDHSGDHVCVSVSRQTSQSIIDTRSSLQNRFLYFIVKKKHAREAALAEQQSNAPGKNTADAEVWKSSTEQNTHM